MSSSAQRTKSRHRRHHSLDMGRVRGTSTQPASMRTFLPMSPKSVLESIPEGRVSPTSSATLSSSYHPLKATLPQHGKPPAPTTKRVKPRHRRAQSLDGSQSFDHMDRHKVLREQIAYLRSKDDMPGLAATLNILGNVFFRQKMFDEAIANYQEAVAAAEMVENGEAKKSLAEAYCNLGTAYWNVNKVSEAIECLLKGLNLLSQLGLPIAAAHYQLGISYTLDRSFDKAHKHLSESITLYQNQEMEMARAYCALANLYQVQDRYSEALRSFQYAKHLREACGAPVIGVLEQIANVHLQAGCLPKALSTFRLVHFKMGDSREVPIDKSRLAHMKNRIDQLTFRLQELP